MKRLAYLFDDGGLDVRPDGATVEACRAEIAKLFDEDDDVKLVEVEIAVIREFPLKEPH